MSIYNETIANTLKKAGLQGSEIPEGVSGTKTFDTQIDKPREILKTYSSKDFLHCSCGKRQPHKNGLLVEFENGNLGLVGKDCAERDFGQDWITLTRDFEIKQASKINKQMIEPTLKRIEHLRELMMRHWAWSDDKDSFFKAIKNTTPETYAKLKDLSNSNGQWTIERSVLKTTTDRFGKERQTRSMDFINLGVIEGYRCVNLNWFSRMSNVGQLLNEAESNLNSRPYKDDVIRKGRKQFNDALRISGLLLDELQASKQFFTSSNIKLICNLVKEDSHFKIKLSANTKRLRVSFPASRYKEHINIDIPIPYNLGQAEYGNINAV